MSLAEWPAAGEDDDVRYLMAVVEEFRPDGLRDDPAGSATASEAAAIDVFDDRLRSSGYWVFAGGLDAPATATVVDARGPESVVTDGPFLESKEHLGGFWIIEAPDLDVALALAAEASRACRRRVEVRPFL